MRRSAARIMVFLILGAIVNVAVAWGISGSAKTPNRLAPTIVSSADQRWWHARVPNTYQATSPQLAFVHLGTGTALLRLAAGTGGMDWPMAHRLRTGWPTLSLERTQWSSRNQLDWHDTWTVYQPFSFSVPLRPVLPGFAINTVFYAAVLWGMVVAPFVLRRRRRIKRGLCLKCAYNLRGTQSIACPECGALIENEVKRP